MSQARQPNPGMEEKNDPQEEVGEGQVEGPKMEMPLRLDFQGLPPGGTGTAPLKEVATPPTTMESLPKVAEPVVEEEESSLDVAVVTVAPTQPPLGPAGAVEAEWAAGVAETTAHLLLAATTMSPRARVAAAGMVRIARSITLPEPGTEVRLAVKVQNTRKSPKGGGRGDQRPAVRVVQVTLVTPTRMTTRNPTPRTARIMPTLLAVLHHPEAPRPESSLQGVCPQGEAGVEVVEVETSTGVVVM